MHQFLADRRVDVPEAHSVLSAKVGLKNGEMLPVERSDRLLDPISQVQLMLRSVNMIKLAGPLF